MKHFEDGEHQANDPVSHGTHERRKLVEKATDKLLREESRRPSLDDDESREREPGQTYVRYNLFR